MYNSLVESTYMGRGRLEQLTECLQRVLDESIRYAMLSADYGRDDRLWPADAAIFTTNPLSLSYGACGPALFLFSAGRLEEVPSVSMWMSDKVVNADEYPPGLFLGSAGIAYVCAKIGLHELFEKATQSQQESGLMFEEAGVSLGAAGWGLANLRIFELTGEQSYLDWAVRAGDHLVASVMHEGNTSYWRCNNDSRIHYGFGYGSSGIAWFLASLYSATGDEVYKRLAVRGLEYDLDKRFESEVGWLWKRFEGDTIMRPYWIHGSAGVGSATIRVYEILGGNHFLKMARRIADDVYIKFSVSPGLFNGLAGVAEFMLDMFQATGDEVYRQRAFDLAETISWFKVEREDGVAWPGRALDRISFDYATGSAGIGLFLIRLLQSGRRFLLDST